MGLETAAVPFDFLCGISQMHLTSPYVNTSASAVTGGWEEREGCRFHQTGSAQCQKGSGKRLSTCSLRPKDEGAEPGLSLLRPKRK